MQKLVLVDEYDREYKRLQRPVAAKAKTDHSLRLSDTLRDGSLADDRKVREYVAELHRYLNVGNRAPLVDGESEGRINWSTEPAKPTSSSSSQRSRAVAKKKKRKAATTKRVQWTQYGPSR